MVSKSGKEIWQLVYIRKKGGYQIRGKNHHMSPQQEGVLSSKGLCSKRRILLYIVYIRIVNKTFVATLYLLSATYTGHILKYQRLYCLKLKRIKCKMKCPLNYHCHFIGEKLKFFKMTHFLQCVNINLVIIKFFDQNRPSK